MSFGVSGKLWRDSLVMYDRTTRSLWSQVQGRAVAGPRVGEELRELPVQLTTWDDWRRRHPDTEVLVKPPLTESRYGGYTNNPDRVGVTGTSYEDQRLPPKSRVLGLSRGGEHAALPMSEIGASPILQIDALGAPLVIFAVADGQAALAYERRVGERILSFEAVARAASPAVQDRETGSSWNPETGVCTDGPLAGERLEPVDGVVGFWAIWSRHHPGAEILLASPPSGP